MSTSAKQWRKAREEGIEYEFPSGNVARIRPIEVDFFFRVGHIPTPLVDVVSKIINGQTQRLTIPATEQVEQTKEWIMFLNELCHYAFVSPSARLEDGDEPMGEDEISVDDISYSDKIRLYMFFAQPAVILQRFREQQVRDVATVDVAKANGDTRQQETENHKVLIERVGDA